MCAEETRSLKAMQESPPCQLQPTNHWPEAQCQKQWVKKSCPALPKHLDAKMAPQPLKESGERQESGDRREEREGVEGVRKGAWGEGREEFKARGGLVSDGHAEKEGR